MPIVEMTTERSIELQQAVDRMRLVSNRFYVGAQEVGFHAFLELTGFINAYIQSCQVSLLNGIDFATCNEHSGRALPLETHQVEYIAEKFKCLFGPAFRENPELLEIFVAKLSQQ